MKIFVKNKSIVIPGEILGEEIDGEGGCFKEGKFLIANRVGLAEVRENKIRVIPLSGRYIPKKGDTIIGKIIDILTGGWLVDLGSPYYGFLPLGEAISERVDLLKVDLSKYFDYGDVIYGKVINVTKTKTVQLSVKGQGIKKLVGGRIVKITSSKVPRVIGKKGSMVNMIKELTKCNIIIGQNGWIWIKGDPKRELIVTKAILKIEEESHTSGLTDRIKELIEREIK